MKECTKEELKADRKAAYRHAQVPTNQWQRSTRHDRRPTMRPTPMLSKQEEQDERREVIENEKRLRNQGSTFSQFAMSDADTDRGRFTTHEKSTVIGTTPTPASEYPAGPNWSADPVPSEPSLGVSVNEMQPCGEPHEVSSDLELPHALATPNPGHEAHTSFSLDVVATTSVKRPGLGLSSRTYRRA
jgi:hypothetical protein